MLTRWLMCAGMFFPSRLDVARPASLNDCMCRRRDIHVYDSCILTLILTLILTECAAGGMYGFLTPLGGA